MGTIREVEKMVHAKEYPEGRGARVGRTIGGEQLRQLDPFLLLGHFKVKPPSGFPDHPHRGFETVTYMMKGSLTHEDFAKHKGTLEPGDLQWMTAGRGVLHSEVPGPEGADGLQLWVNLAKADKMLEPAYQELKGKDIPVATQDGASVIVIAGESLGIKSPVRTRTPTSYLDVTLAPGASLVQPVDPGWNAFSYVLHGKVTFGPEGRQQEIGTDCCVVYSKAGDSVQAVNRGTEAARFLIIAGKTLNEPMVRDGPFVMNTQEEIEQAYTDFAGAKNGFENAKKWKSEYSRRKAY